MSLANAIEALNLQQPSVNPQEVSIYNVFLIKYTNKEFLTKFVNVCLYQADLSVIAGINKNNEVIKFFRTFLNHLSEDIKQSKSLNIPSKPLLNTIGVIKKILDIKEDAAARLLTYDTVEKHFSTVDAFCQRIIEQVKEDRIDNFQKFKSELEDVTSHITLYNQIKEIKFFSDELDILREDSSRGDTSPLNLLKTYKTVIDKAHSILSSPTFRNISSEGNEQTYLEFFDESSLSGITSSLLKYLSTSFNFFKSDYKLIDDYLDGIESSSVYVVSAASNVGKSLYMINLLRKLIINPLNKFDPNDMIIFITLEDDIYKLTRRLLSIFGNINPKIAKKLFVHCSELIKQNEEIDIKSQSIKNAILKLLERIINSAIHSITKDRVRLFIVHSNEHGFCMNDASTLIDRKKAEGYNVKALFVDYIDCLAVSNKVSAKNGGSSPDTYVNQGLIVQEMRLVSRQQKIPVITVTQNGKLSENTQQDLNNALIGDSYLKVRYCDFLLMMRQELDKTIADPAVMKDIMPQNVQITDLASLEYQSELIPLFIKITKAKEGNKGNRYHIFNRLNLRIYDNFEEIKQDMDEYKLISAELIKEIESVGLVLNDSFLFDETPSGDELDISFF
jgi:replicative DNA helicase